MSAHPLSLNHLSTGNPRPRNSSRTDPPNSSRTMAFSDVSEPVDDELSEVSEGDEVAEEGCDNKEGRARVREDVTVIVSDRARGVRCSATQLAGLESNSRLVGPSRCRLSYPCEDSCWRTMSLRHLPPPLFPTIAPHFEAVSRS